MNPVFLFQMQRHELAQHMQEFTQMHMRYMADFLRGLSLNGTSPRSLWALGPSLSSEDQGAAALASPSACRGAASCSGNSAPCQPSEEMQRIREMDARLVKQDHQLRELIILKDTQVRDHRMFHVSQFLFFSFLLLKSRFHPVLRQASLQSSSGGCLCWRTP